MTMSVRSQPATPAPLRAFAWPLRALTSLCVALLAAICMGALDASPALAKAAPGQPEYSLSIVEGESTLPENSIVHTSGSVQPKAPIALSILRSGTVIARTTGTENVWLSPVPEVGDVVTLESPIGTVVGSVVYDGLPSIEPTVCAGSTNFSGQRSAGEEVEGGFYTLLLETDPYGHSSVRQTAAGRAQVTLLSGSSFAGSFLAPLQPGETVFASESLQTPLAGGAVFTYSSENDRPVGACPPPPPSQTPPPPPPPALQGSVLKLSKTTIKGLLKSGFADHVTINQPGTVVQDLYLQGGKLPAYASARRGRRAASTAMLLARGSASAASAGQVNVVLHLTSEGRRRLRHARSVRAILETTLLSDSGAKLALERHSLSLYR